MTSSFSQCAAIKPDGARCRRTAQLDAKYCHSHRCYRPKERHQPQPWERLASNYFTCSACGHMIPPGKALVLHKIEAETEVLCEPCLRLRDQIETRILELFPHPGGRSKEEILEDLARFGVDQDLVEAARLRMHADGRLVYAKGGDGQ
jgi:hypothetical protein